MKIKLTSILLFLLIYNGISQSINESFIIRVIPDQGWFLKFDKKNNFEYYIGNFIGGSTILSKGKYTLKDNRITLNPINFDSTDFIYNNKNLYLTKIRLNKHKKIIGNYVNEKKSLFGTKFIILSENKFNDSLIMDYHPECIVILTRKQYKRKKDKAYILSSNKVKYIDRWNHKKIKNYEILNNEKASIFKEICSIDKRKIKAYEAEVNKHQSNTRDYRPPLQITLFDENGNQTDKFEFCYFYSSKLNPETLEFLDKLRKLFERNK